MRMVRTCVLIPVLALVASGCASTTAADGAVEIRIANDSPVTFDAVRVVFPEEEEEYGAVLPGRHTEYREVEQAYRYAYVEVRIGGEVLVLQPIDYVGESPLRPGRYTYVLDVGPALDHVTLELRQPD